MIKHGFGKLPAIYAEGSAHQLAGGSIDVGPWVKEGGIAEVAWRQGFEDAASGEVDQSYCGYPVAGKPAPVFTF